MTVVLFPGDVPLLGRTRAPQAQAVTTRRRIGAQRRPGERVAQYSRRFIIDALEYWVARSRAGR
jgi:hypothetical protein